ncbi:uncharacterized protein EI90DRAFT_3015366 [Cantharellus anzutake]|uniref:uncharacterized protein n=1 Tax=Cantharellus anzutake TaxID=1750568 RepID=UPI0019050776|nr:uncharacterized protein EI90DRAFT_3015366 [Cantharellus anzutake]KAF8333476.1 hypothetical protein EI90DRAFT_3015366 [Cantharellus anzutake]
MNQELRLITRNTKKFKSDKKEWDEFGKYVVEVVVEVLAAIESYDTSTEEAKPWLENIKKLDDALRKITTEMKPILAKMEKWSAVTNFSHLKHPGRIDDFKKVLDRALTIFQVILSCIIVPPLS